MDEDIKKDLLKDVKRIQEEMDLLFSHFYKIRHSPVASGQRIWRPPMDVFETEDEVIIILEIAGMKQKDLSITLASNILTIRGERKELRSPSRTCYYNMEVNYGPFERSIYLPKEIAKDKDNVSASYKDGFLEVKVSKKSHKKAKAKEIKIVEES